MFPGSGLREERIEGVVSGSDGFIRGHLSIRLDSLKKTQKNVIYLLKLCKDDDIENLIAFTIWENLD